MLGSLLQSCLSFLSIFSVLVFRDFGNLCSLLYGERCYRLRAVTPDGSGSCCGVGQVFVGLIFVLNCLGKGVVEYGQIKGLVHCELHVTRVHSLELLLILNIHAGRSHGSVETSIQSNHLSILINRLRDWSQIVTSVSIGLLIAL